jgi:uncharacterized protein YjbI with pentapeptide repeats
MANPEHLEILERGRDVWNQWRKERPYVRPDLRGSDLRKYCLGCIDLSGADLNLADFTTGNLPGTYLAAANFSRANLEGAKLFEAYLPESSFIEADLSRADLRHADLSVAYFTRARLCGTYLTGAKFFRARLAKADLGGAFLGYANFTKADLSGADLSGARMEATVFANTNLSEVKGLDSVIHAGPSSISLDTIFISGGRIPEAFLRGCGVPESFIVQIPALVAAMQPIQFYSCFISYSSRDQEFAERLHADLQAKGVRVWFAPHDMPVGARLRPTIDESIRVYDKLLLVLSGHSVSSQWVEQEVETALKKERQADGTVLFPIRLDDTVFKVGEGWPALIKNTRHVGDFTRWKEHDSYQKAFDRLLRDLKAGE